MKIDLIIAIIGSVLVGMLIAFGLVLVVTFLASPEACRQALFSLL